MNFPPVAYMIGAAKTGTTTLAGLLATHPDIGLSEPKEPDYFGGNFDRGVDWYRQCFQHCAEKSVLVDASTSYAAALWDAPCTSVAARIRSARPDAKLIYVVRDPVQRAWSSYWHSVRAGEEAHSHELALSTAHSVHITAGLYHQRIGEFLQHFPRSSLLIVDFRELTAAPDAAARRVAAFLGADPARLPVSAAADGHRNTSFRWNRLGEAVTRTVGLEGVRRLATTARALLPIAIYNRAKSTLSKPTPTLPSNLARFLTAYFAEDAARLRQDFGIEVRQGPWWKLQRSPDLPRIAANSTP